VLYQAAVPCARSSTAGAWWQGAPSRHALLSGPGAVLPQPLWWTLFGGNRLAHLVCTGRGSAGEQGGTGGVRGTVVAELEACVRALCMHACGMMQHRPLPLVSLARHVQVVATVALVAVSCACGGGAHLPGVLPAGARKGGNVGPGFEPADHGMCQGQSRAARVWYGCRKLFLQLAPLLGKQESWAVLPSSGSGMPADMLLLVGMLMHGMAGGVFCRRRTCVHTAGRCQPWVFFVSGVAVPWPGATCPAGRHGPGWWALRQIAQPSQLLPSLAGCV
jgi:hypothetical protein